MVSSRHLANLRAPELPGALTKDSVIVLPLGAIEQHGPHLPLNTDFVVADEVSKAAVEKVGEETNAWLLPTLPFTKSNEHAWSAGTMWLSATTLMAVLDDIARSVASTPARKLLFINGHGGNSALTAMMNREIRLKWGLQTFLAHPHMPADQGGSSAESELGMGVHGGMDETSVMLHLRPELVDMSVAVRRVPEKLAQNDHVRFGGKVAFGWLSNDFFPDGHIGDPTGANAEIGSRMFDSAVKSLSGALREISTFDFGR
jgi:creatinine amidohydrolase